MTVSSYLDKYNFSTQEMFKKRTSQLKANTRKINKKIEVDSGDLGNGKMREINQQFFALLKYPK